MDYNDNNTYSGDVNNPNFDESGKNTQKAIGNASQAAQIASALDVADKARDIERARVLAAFNGATPYEEAALLASAQSYRFNISFGFMEGAVGRAVVPYNELALDNKFVANVEAEDLSESKRNIVREELDAIIKEWGKWPKHVSRQNQDLVLNGYNNNIWPTDYNPWPIFVPQKEGRVYDLSPNDTHDLEVYSWNKSYMIHELYNQISDEKAARAAGWNVENVRKALENALPETIYKRDSSGDWMRVESAIRGGALFASICGGKKVNTSHVLASELGGKVTHYVVDRTVGLAGTSDNPGEVNGLELFKKEKRFDSFEDFLVYFDMEAGDGTWHGSKGLGRRAYNTHLSIDKLRNGLLDQAFLSGLTLLQLGDQNSQEDFNLTVAGPFCVIPAGVSISNTAIPTLPTTSFQLDGLLNATAEGRFGDLVPNAAGSLGPDKTATQAKIDASRTSLITKGNLQRYTDPLSKTLSIITRRLLKKNSPNAWAKKFQDKLRKRGVSDEDMAKVRECQSTGSIDAVMGRDTQVMSNLMATFRGDPDINQKELKRRYISAVAGTKEVEGLLIENTDNTIVLEATREQMEEVGTMTGFIQVPVSPRDNHLVHFPVAAEWLEGQLKSYADGKGGVPYDALQLVLKHIEDHAIEMHKNDQWKVEAKKADEVIKQIHAEFKHLEDTPVSAAPPNPLPQNGNPAIPA